MTARSARLASLAWSNRTGSRLTGAETRQILPPLARGHAANAVGRATMLLQLHTGRRGARQPNGPRRRS